MRVSGYAAIRFCKERLDFAVCGLSLSEYVLEVQIYELTGINRNPSFLPVLGTILATLAKRDGIKTNGCQGGIVCEANQEN